MLSLFIGIEVDLIAGVANVPNRQRKPEFAPAGLVEFPLMHALFENT